MSTIVVVRGSDGICIGADSYFGNSTSREGMCRVRKLHRFGPNCVVGAVGASVICQMVPKLWPVEDLPGPPIELHKRLREYARGQDLLRSCDDGTKDISCSYIVVWDDQIWAVRNDGCAFEVDKWHAIGSGEDYALGALVVLDDLGINDPKDIVERALEAATTFSIYTEPPFVYEWVPDHTHKIS